MKNNRKKQTSSYLLIFLGIVAFTNSYHSLPYFLQKDSQRSINLAKNGSATAQTEDFTDGKLPDLPLGDETEDADQSGFVSDDEIPTAKLLSDDSLSRTFPERKCRFCTVFSNSGGSNCSYQTLSQYRTSRSFPVIRFQLRSDNRWHFPGKKRFYHGCYYPELSDDDGTISPSHGSSAFDNKSDEKMDTPGLSGSIPASCFKRFLERLYL